MSTYNILLLVYRNLFAAIDKMFLMWQIAFPVVYIFVAGYAYSAMIGNQGLNLGSLSISYVSFLTAGMIGFNVMNGSTVAGAIMWNDKRNGMFQQLLVMPFSRVQYIIGNLITIILIGLASAGSYYDNWSSNNASGCKHYFMEHTLHDIRIGSRLDILWFIYNNFVNKDQK